MMHVQYGLCPVTGMCVSCVLNLFSPQSLSECEDSNFAEFADHVYEGFKGTLTSL